eukprot:TRINITY_DN6382_c0_g3_i2.p1 TRINITY_DN6382_c0_g3~~TRINITY_DN6382_c0_g3_i2.p1  ORF type:complete len:345 (-),score=85.43 TRINITY_DN6382_c0_g3_i2:317-1201(-)
MDIKLNTKETIQMKLSDYSKEVNNIVTRISSDMEIYQDEIAHTKQKIINSTVRDTKKNRRKSAGIQVRKRGASLVELMGDLTSGKFIEEKETLKEIDEDQGEKTHKKKKNRKNFSRISPRVSGSKLSSNRKSDTVSSLKPRRNGGIMPRKGNDLFSNPKKSSSISHFNTPRRRTKSPRHNRSPRSEKVRPRSTMIRNLHSNPSDTDIADMEEEVGDVSNKLEQDTSEIQNNSQEVAKIDDEVQIRIQKARYTIGVVLTGFKENKLKRIYEEISSGANIEYIKIALTTIKFIKTV